MSKTLAISLGSRFTSAAFVNEESIPTLLSFAENPSNEEQKYDRAQELGPFLLRSCLAVSEQEIIVGQAAERRFEDGRDVTLIDSFLKRLGSTRPFHAELGIERRWAKDRMPDESYRKTPEEMSPASIAPRGLTADQCSEIFLRHCRNVARRSQAGLATRAILAVPSYLNSRQRTGLSKSARRAGFTEVQLVEASLASSVFLNRNRRLPKILVCDLGATHFEASLLSCEPTRQQVLATSTNTQLGGLHLAEALVEELVSDTWSQIPTVVREDDRKAALRPFVDSIIGELMHDGKDLINVRTFMNGYPCDWRLTADGWAKLAKPWVDAMLESIERCLSDANEHATSLDQIYFTGGLAKLPGLAKAIEERFGIDVDKISRDRTMFASVFGAAMLGSQDREPSSLWRDCQAVATHDVGIRIRDPQSGSISIIPLLPRNSALPAKTARTLKTARKDQDRLIVELVQSISDENSSVVLGTYEFGPLLSRYERYPVELKVRYNEQGMVEVSARDGVTGEPLKDIRQASPCS
jgi:molecular chaperone DnaK (HSP70)